MRLLITAGPTREYIDTIRFISNPSSGKMGYSLARSAHHLGHKTTLVTGPTSQTQPNGVKVIEIETAEAMRTAVNKLFRATDCLVMAAAVSDYRPAGKFNGKIKKHRSFNLRLVRNPDILKEISRIKGNRILVGFALETNNGRHNAFRKLRDKHLDYIVLNTPDALGTDKTTAEILSHQGVIKRFSKISKASLSYYLIKLIERKYRTKAKSRVLADQ